MPADEVPPCFVQLGRFGDLILLLPAFKEWADRMGVPTPVVTCNEFASVLQGCSYVSPIILNMHWHNQLGEAVNYARSQYPNVVVTQLHGAGWRAEPDDLPSFSLSMWRRTGLLELYGELLPVFDRRNKFFESQLVKQFRRNKPLLLVNYASWTSTLHCEQHVQRVISGFAHKFDIVNTSFVKAPRCFDLLGLMDAAAGLVTVDTMTLHLAAASKVPYVAFVRDDAQSGSIPKGNCELVIGYSQVEKRLHELVETLNRWAG